MHQERGNQMSDEATDPKPAKPVSYYLGTDWPREKARAWVKDHIRWHRSQAKYFADNQDHIRWHRSQAKYFADNLEGFETSQEEFELLLEHGLGWSAEEIEDAVGEIRGEYPARVTTSEITWSQEEPEHEEGVHYLVIFYGSTELSIVNWHDPYWWDADSGINPACVRWWGRLAIPLGVQP
jgi:hypothetical protein